MPMPFPNVSPLSIGGRETPFIRGFTKTPTLPASMRGVVFHSGQANATQPLSGFAWSPASGFDRIHDVIIMKPQGHGARRVDIPSIPRMLDGFLYAGIYGDMPIVEAGEIVLFTLAREAPGPVNITAANPIVKLYMW